MGLEVGVLVGLIVEVMVVVGVGAAPASAYGWCHGWWHMELKGENADIGPSEGGVSNISVLIPTPWAKYGP